MKIVSLSFCLVALVPAYAGVAEIAANLEPEIRVEDFQRTVQYLADDKSGGRLTGTDGILRAAWYIEATFERFGLQAPPGMDDYFQPFSFTSGVRLIEGKNHLAAGEEKFAVQEQFVPLMFSGNGVAEGDVVFVGYGIVEPGEGTYDSYLGVDVKGKIVLSLRDLPEDVTPERRQELALYAGDRYKAKLAADRGAAGFLLVIGPSSPNGGELIRFRESHRGSAIPIPAASVTQAAADRLIAPSKKTVAEVQKSLDGGEINPHAGAPEGVALRLEVEIERLTDECRNVLGYIPPSDGVDEVVLVGGHYDHIGTGEGLGSLAKKGEEGKIHNGADDNASGTSLMLELAGAFAAAVQDIGDKPHRGLLFAAWSGEELGLVGSDYFTEHPPIPLDKIVAYFNFDMVGRLRNNTLVVKAVGSSSIWRGLLERRNIPAGFNLSMLDDPYLPTDLTSMYTKDVPGLDFFTDLHDDYNRPTDDPKTLDYEGMVRVAKFAKQLIVDVLDPSREVDFVRVKQTTSPSGGMGRRVYTGMVPDFGGGGDVDGMLLSDVRPGGPAEKAGLTGGDIVVEFAGKSIGSLQDYSDALRGAKVDDPVTIIVIRDGERVSLTITPEARKQ